MRKNSIKNTRINGEVQRELSMLISREIKDPRIHPMTSVVAVDVAPDLKSAKVYISVLGDEQAQKSTLVGLRSAAPYMRGQLAKTINLRNTPELIFVIDQSIEYGVNMSHLIHEVTKDLPNDEEETEEAEDEELEEEEAEEETSEDSRLE
ncbi:30S ribosome-binding factor RbfA [Anaerocolumna chitinilytica]|uniref:Ribosome-binding factor A n=1 Tax=Anaerocolumna chitinilytica TaxID=1727145 RepID=A0A7I8DS91_9FIRM|nr:30S ribosome-binding factor RbfA [Anaerocolumna chitinilytica]BCK00102.1 ribosome-binding factor A [Anaerocolumna chitinilytica]